MKINTMRRIDTWLGVPLCVLLTVFREFANLFGSRALPPVRKILFVKFAEQGATVLAWSAIRRAVEKVGKENVYFAVFENNRPILDVLDVIPPQNVISIPAKGLSATLTGFCRAIMRVRRENIDTVLDFEFFARVSAVFCYLCGARRRVGLHTWTGVSGYRGDLMTHPIPWNSHIHCIDTYGILYDAIDADLSDLPALDLKVSPSQARDLPRFTPRPDEVEDVRRLLCSLLKCDTLGPIVIINANASDLMPLRCWSPARYLELTKLLMDRFPDVSFVFTGGPDEIAPIEKMVSSLGSPRCVSLAGRTDFRRLMTLYTLARVIVTNDSGPAHFASMTPISIVVLFGPETPLLFAPLSPNTSVAYAHQACSPCISVLTGRATKCTNNLCMKAITVDQVFRQTCAAIESQRAPK